MYNRKRIMRRKIITLAAMLVTLFRFILAAGIVKRREAHAEEVNPTEWEVVKTEYKFVDTAGQPFNKSDFPSSSCISAAWISVVPNGIKFGIDLGGAYSEVYFSVQDYFSDSFILLSCKGGSTIKFYNCLPFDFGEMAANSSSETVITIDRFESCSKIVYTDLFGMNSSTLTDFSFRNFRCAVDGTPDNTEYGYFWSDVNDFSIYQRSSSTVSYSRILHLPFSLSETKYYKLPAAPEKEGYNFTGWYTDEACTKKYTGTTVTADTALYAGYEKQILTVTLDNDGATETMTVEYGNTVTLPDKTKDGYDFLGWYFSDDTKYVDQAITSNVTLTAKYRKKPVITLDNNGITETLTVEYNEAASLPTKTKTGYNFLGWYDETGTKYDGQAVTSDLTLTAKFEVIMLKVRFFVDDAEYKSVEVPYGSKFSEAVEKASLKQTSVKSVVLLTSVAGEGEETPAEDQTIPDELTSDVNATVDVSAIDAAKEQTSGWFKTTWEKIASFFVNLWEKISSFFAGAWEAVCNHFRNNWKWYAIGGGSAAGLAIVIAVICKVRR